MKALKKTGIFYLLLVLPFTGADAQVIENVQNSFKQYNDKVLQEKIYTHTDKNAYLAGEILWFKVYDVDAGLNQPLNLSKVAYVEVLDDANIPVLQAKVALNNGLGNGSFYLPVNLKSGNYKFRAYTNWMKNFGADLYFEKVITIVNFLNKTPPVRQSVEKKPDIRFFAEGGTLLSGAENTIAFKATGTDGKGMDINGVVINQRNDTVARFQTLKFGMGSFSFSPKAGATYKAVVRIGRDNSLISDLPPVNADGYAIHLVNINSQPAIKISVRGHDGQQVYLFIHNGHKVILAQSATPDANGSALVAINKEKLGEGINHITLFNSSGQPVCERLYFNRPNLLKLRASAGFQYKTREPVNINITAANYADKPLAANMSAAVYRLDSLSNQEAGDIASYFWLSSELKGDIESPGYYFDVITAETDEALDNLLLTQGWSRYKWADVLTPTRVKQFTFLPEHNGPLITGSVSGQSGVSPRDVTVYLGVIGKRVQLYSANADDAGNLLFNTRDIYGRGQLVLQASTAKDSALRISLANPFSEQYSGATLPFFQLTKTLRQSLESRGISMKVQNIYSGGQINHYYSPFIDSGAFYKQVAKRYLLDDFTRFPTMEEVLREYVAELTVAKKQGRYHLHMLSKNGYFEKDPLVLLDGVPIFNIDKIFTIDPLKVKMLDVVTNRYYWGPMFANGILSFTTYKGDMGGYEIDPGAIALDYEGMQLEREFYSPVYQTEQQQKSRTPDFRNVLYWSPDINTDTKGKSSISFYTSDKTGKYIVVFQGLTTDGLAGSYTLKFDVVN